VALHSCSLFMRVSGTTYIPILFSCMFLFLCRRWQKLGFIVSLFEMWLAAFKLLLLKTKKATANRCDVQR
jgi:hypothetical protein